MNYDILRMDVSGEVTEQPTFVTGESTRLTFTLLSLVDIGKDFPAKEYTRITFWGKLAERYKELKKGQRVIVTNLRKSTRKGNDDKLYTNFESKILTELLFIAGGSVAAPMAPRLQTAEMASDGSPVAMPETRSMPARRPAAPAAPIAPVVADEDDDWLL